MLLRRLPAVHFAKGSRQFGSLQSIADSFVQLHDASGVPWLVLIPTATFALRTVFTLPLSIWQRKRIVKQQELRKVVQSVPPVVKLRLASMTARANHEELSSSGSAIQTKEETVGALQRGKRQLTPDQITMLSLKEMRKRQKVLFKKYNVQMWKNSVLPLVQVPLWVTMSMGLRKLTDSRLVDTNMPHAHVLQDLSETSWLTHIGSLDLSLPLDVAPMLIPIVLGTVSMINVEYNGKMMQATAVGTSGITTATDTQSRTSQTLNSILTATRLSTIFLIGVSTQASVLLSLYWITSQVYSLIQNRILDLLWPYQR
ncbi:Cox18 [Kluyveromyces lactis]|nr:Cox18 [Kluyveromyces lactis]